MLQLAKFETQIKSFQDRFGTNIITAEQGSLAWLQSRLGVITSSEVSKAVAKVGTETRNTYMCQLVAEVATGVVEEINSKAIDWGNLNEQSARSTYEFANDAIVDKVTFLFKDDSFREGSSLDGIVRGTGKPVEIKCPYNPTNYIKFFVDDKIKAEYQWQYQHQIRVSGADEIDFAQFDPRMSVSPIKTLTVSRDEEYQQKFDELLPAFISDMDKMLAKIGVQFGDQWKRIASRGLNA